MTSSDSTVKFEGKFQVQLLSMTYDCTFHFERGKGATFKTVGSGPFTTNDPEPTMKGTTAHVDLNITG